MIRLAQLELFVKSKLKKAGETMRINRKKLIIAMLDNDQTVIQLAKAKELYPEWYEKRIVQGEPKQQSKKQGGTWVCNEALYEWWKRKIKIGRAHV